MTWALLRMSPTSIAKEIRMRGILGTPLVSQQEVSHNLQYTRGEDTNLLSWVVESE